jgi:Spy/CpxP family protein refolding chaperone
MRRVANVRAIMLVLAAALLAGTVADAADAPQGTAPRSWETRLQQQLGLRDDQVQAIREIREREAAAWRQHWQTLRQARAELRRLILSEADEAKIQARHAEVQQLMADGLTRRINTLREITPLLTPEQREKFAAMMEQSRQYFRGSRRPQQQS